MNYWKYDQLKIWQFSISVVLLLKIIVLSFLNSLFSTQNNALCCGICPPSGPVPAGGINKVGVFLKAKSDDSSILEMIERRKQWQSLSHQRVNLKPQDAWKIWYWTCVEIERFYKTSDTKLVLVPMSALSLRDPSPNFRRNHGKLQTVCSKSSILDRTWHLQSSYDGRTTRPVLRPVINVLQIEKKKLNWA